MTASLRLRAVQLGHRLRRRLPWGVGALGVVALCAGVVELFTTYHGARSAFLLALGVALVLVALLGGRVELEGFEILGAKVRVRDVVKSRLELAESPEQGDPLHRQALVLRKLVGLYGLYEHIRYRRDDDLMAVSDRLLARLDTDP